MGERAIKKGIEEVSGRRSHTATPFHAHKKKKKKNRDVAIDTNNEDGSPGERHKESLTVSSGYRKNKGTNRREICEPN